MLSARRVPEVLRANISDAQLREAVEPLIDDAADNSCIAVTLNGRLLAGNDVSEPKTPASLVKVLTATAVMKGLDPTSRLQTTAATTGSVENGVVDGDLYIIGGGDPLLTTPGYQATFKDPDQTDQPVRAARRQHRGGRRHRDPWRPRRRRLPLRDRALGPHLAHQLPHRR